MTQITTYSIDLKKVFYKSLLVLAIATLFSCRKPPEFDIKPHITFANISVTNQYNSSLQAYADSVTISVKFKDGDGDLGVESADLGNVKYRFFSDTLLDNDSNKTFVFRNYYCEMLRKSNGVYAKVKLPISFNGTFEELIEYDQIGPIEGVLNYSLTLNPASMLNFLNKNDTVKFEVYLVDRNLNISNTILTDSIVILQNVK